VSVTASPSPRSITTTTCDVTHCRPVQFFHVRFGCLPPVCGLHVCCVLHADLCCCCRKEDGFQATLERHALRHNAKKQTRIDNRSAGSSGTHCSLWWATTAAGSSSNHTTARNIAISTSVVDSFNVLLDPASGAVPLFLLVINELRACPCCCPVLCRCCISAPAVLQAQVLLLRLPRRSSRPQHRQTK
jgi:hypothetical protein